jgi:hypothetical protein
MTTLTSHTVAEAITDPAELDLMPLPWQSRLEADSAEPSEASAHTAVEQRPVEERPGQGTRRRFLPRMAVAILMLLVVAGTTGTIVGWRGKSHANALLHAQRDVVNTAGGLARAMLSYNASDLDFTRKQVLALSTAHYGTIYDQAFTQALGGVIGQLQANASATLRDVYVTSIRGHSAKAIVVMDFTVKSTAGTVNRPGTYLMLDLVDQGGHWKVDNVNALGFTSQTQTPPTGSGSTPSSAATTPPPVPPKVPTP